MKAELLEKMQSVEPATREAMFLMVEEFTNQSRLLTISRTDFADLKGIVRDLAVAQARTEQRVDTLATRMEELTQAEARSEQRLDKLATRMDELAKAQERTDESIKELTQAQARTEQRVDKLAIRMDELAQAQERTDQSIKELTQAQERTDRSIKELTEAQERTDRSIKELTEAQARTEVTLQRLSESDTEIRKQMGGLSMAVGYGLEDRLMPHIPAFAEKTFDIHAQIVDRRNIVYPDGRYDEANLYVEGEKDGQLVYLIGECKSQPGKRDFDKFASLLGRIREHRDGDVLGMMIGYQYAPDVEEYARATYPTIRFFKTFEVERAGR